MANAYKTNCSSLVVIREMEIRNTTYPITHAPQWLNGRDGSSTDEYILCLMYSIPQCIFFFNFLNFNFFCFSSVYFQYKTIHMFTERPEL